ncbi:MULTISPECIES: hypothetical protein [unclassified Thioalkalivibrio]|uniref:hypothetical protein n=1 Tax=unclassified Thioalkalivibrio TaxID=2621013 RepID=UPI000364F271|nr:MULTISPECIES: hypothetical protein [unclassified Thioalkalivibrio]
MERLNKNAPAAGEAARGAGNEHDQALKSEYITADDLFRIAHVRAHVIGAYRGREKTRAKLRFIAALKAALSRGDQ